MVALHEALTPAPEQVALAIFGAFHERDETLVLLGPHEPGFWAHFTASAEYQDGQPDPLDRWSRRVITCLAEDWGGAPVFPSDGPPYAPFLDWALETGQAWQSPVGMLVHARAGLMVSYRGAVRLQGRLDLPPPGRNPCRNCADKPCLTACPVGALNAQMEYDVQRCKTHISHPEGSTCLTKGCLVRRACPVSQDYARLPEQSAFHMRSFL